VDNQNIGGVGQGMAITDEIIVVSQLLGACARAAPQVYTYVPSSFRAWLVEWWWSVPSVWKVAGLTPSLAAT